MLDITNSSEFQAKFKGTLPDHLGFEVTSVNDQGLTASFVVQPHHLAPNGYLHAASIVMLADTSCGLAAC